MNKKLKKIFLTFLLGLILMGLTAGLTNAGQVSLTTYYPAPIGNYDRLTLTAQEDTGFIEPCPIGSFMLNETTGYVMYCHNNSGSGEWELPERTWERTSQDIYPTATSSNENILMGIGTSTPYVKLTLNNDGGILAQGSLGAGTIVDYNFLSLTRSGPPMRFLWYPRKAAFHAVEDPSGFTTDATIGNHSTAFGKNVLTSGTASTAAGQNNSATGDYAIVIGGNNNTTSAAAATITGGANNLAADDWTAVSGSANTARGAYDSISGGDQNTTSINGQAQSIGGGRQNTIAQFSNHATIAGGQSNSISNGTGVLDPPAQGSFIAGGLSNQAQGGVYNTFGGGQANISYGNNYYIGGGGSNLFGVSWTFNPFGDFSVIAGGFNNLIAGTHPTVAGGRRNQANGNYSAVGGGFNNVVSGTHAMIAGGQGNSSGGTHSVIAGGWGHDSQSDHTWIAGRGVTIPISTPRTFVWGYSDTGVTVSTPDSFILPSGTNTGWANVEPRLGIRDTTPTGAVLNIQGNGSEDYFAVTSNNKVTAGDIFIITSAGRVGIGNPSPDHPLHFGAQANGAYLTSGGAWTTPSSRDLKDNIAPLHPEDAAAALKELEPVIYRYKKNPEEEYVGLIAEDVPELIAENERKGLEPMTLTAVLTSVLKKQKKQIAEQDLLLEKADEEILQLRKLLGE